VTRELRAKPLIREFYSQLKSEIETIDDDLTLAVLMIGEDPAAEFYIRNIEKKGIKVGIKILTVSFPASVHQTELLNKLYEFNKARNINGIMVQKPLPSQIDEDTINESIDPIKDVDGFHPVNMGNLVLGKDSLLPSTPAAVLEILKYYQIDTSGKNIVILGRSNIVGKPLMNLLLRKDETGNGTITVCHSRSRDLESITSKADILIAAIGKPLFVTSDMIKQDAVLIDVGINQIKDDEKGYRYVGDIDYEGCYCKAASITPVPGGVGSVTTAVLLNNVLSAFKKQ